MTVYSNPSFCLNVALLFYSIHVNININQPNKYKRTDIVEAKIQKGKAAAPATKHIK